MALLEVKNLTMRFGGIVAVDNLSFHVNEGELISLIGPNGAGKTTVFNVLTGIYTPTEGEVIFDGKNIVGKSSQDIVIMGISRTFQNLRLYRNMRTIENVLVGDHINTDYSFIDLLFRTKKFREGEIKAHEKALNILKMVGLLDKADTYADSLPYGEQRRLEIARAIATGARVLLLDEPAAGMNPTESENLMQFIRSLLSQGFTVVMIEHDMNIVMNISDRIYVLDFGKLIAEGKPEEIANNPRVIEAYLGGGDLDEDA
jgi:branched-chain amino acid transport system ATP-binding protein